MFRIFSTQKKIFKIFDNWSKKKFAKIFSSFFFPFEIEKFFPIFFSKKFLKNFFHKNQAIFFSSYSTSNFTSYHQCSRERVNLNLAVLSNQDLIELLQDLQGPPRNAKVKIRIQIFQLDLESFEKEFREYLDRAKNVPANQSVILDFKFFVHFSDIVWSLLKLTSEIFGKVTFNSSNFF